MSWLDDLRGLDINEPAEWPPWFVVVVSFMVCLALLFGHWRIAAGARRIQTLVTLEFLHFV